MTPKQKAYRQGYLYGDELYSVESLQKILFAMGVEIGEQDLYFALKCTGWIKLRLIRDRLLELKRQIPKDKAFHGIRQIVKDPLQVPRDEDLPGYDFSP